MIGGQAWQAVISSTGFYTMASTIRVHTNRGSVLFDELSTSQGTSFFPINADTITVSASWQGKMVRFQKACTVTIPSGLPDDFSCGWSQESSGIITFVQGSGVVVESVSGQKKSAGQFSMGGLAGWGDGKIRLFGSLAA